MSAIQQRAAVLNEEQRRRVDENIGLVGVHLRRYAADFGIKREQHDQEDLFQEGCLGLIQAALTYSTDRGIPFAAYALPRIHQAVHQAIARQASTARSDRPMMKRLSAEAASRMPDRRRNHPFRRGRVTIGRKLRGKVERALGRAKRQVARGVSPRGDRRQLVDAVMEERLRIPDADHRTSLRELARRTKSSVARVVQCDKRLAHLARRALEADAEFGTLRQWARALPDGAETAMNGRLDGELAEAGAHEFVRRYHEAKEEERPRLLRLWLHVTRFDLEAAIGDEVRHLVPKAREHLLWASRRRPARPCSSRSRPQGKKRPVHSKK